jgi:RNA polymerase sigma factor (sigma-70 family)
MAAAMHPIEPSRAFASEPVAALHARLRRPLLRFFAGYRLTTQDVEDLTQDVFVRLASHCPPDLRRPEAYVFTLARNLLRDRARRLHTRAAQSSVTLDDVDLSCGAARPDEVLEQGERLERAADALAALRPATRRAFLLHRVHGHSYAEVATATGVSVSMVEKHVMAAIAALRATAE